MYSTYLKALLKKSLRLGLRRPTSLFTRATGVEPMRCRQWQWIKVQCRGNGLPTKAQQRATNGRPYNIACTTDNAVGASIARPLVIVLSAVRHRDGTIFSIANVGGELPLATSECLPLAELEGKVPPLAADEVSSSHAALAAHFVEIIKWINSLFRKNRRLSYCFRTQCKRHVPQFINTSSVTFGDSFPSGFARGSQCRGNYAALSFHHFK